MIQKDILLQYLDNVTDPEVPVLTIRDLGVLRDVIIHDDRHVEVIITPTYSGCPAMSAIATSVRLELMSRGIPQVTVTEVLSPAWTTDWMSDEGKEKLRQYGIAPPQYSTTNNPSEYQAVVPCPQCESTHTELISQFGSTACKALYKCKDCLEPFDYFKCH